MNSILKFFASLLPSFERSQIQEDIEQLRKDVNDNLVPAFRAAARDMSGKGFKSALLNKFNAVYCYAFPQAKRGGFVEGILHFYAPVEANLAVIEEYVLELFAKDVTKEALTYRKVNIIQYLEMLRFVNRYSGRLLLRFLTAETGAVLGKGDQYDAALTPMELRWLNENQNAYIAAMKALNHQPAQLRAVLESIPDIVVIPERSEIVRQTVGADKLDPLKFGLINFALNANIHPLYHLRMVVAEQQVANYKRMLEEKRVLELRLLALKESYEGKQDAKLSQHIEYSAGRLEKLNYQIDKLTADYLG